MYKNIRSIFFTDYMLNEYILIIYILCADDLQVIIFCFFSFLTSQIKWVKLKSIRNICNAVYFCADVSAEKKLLKLVANEYFETQRKVFSYDFLKKKQLLIKTRWIEWS